MRHIKKVNEFFQKDDETNEINLLEDMDKRLQGNSKWEEFVNTSFDEFSVDNWFDWWHNGGDFEKAISYGEQLCIE